jgi:hypothetical protein
MIFDTSALIAILRDEPEAVSRAQRSRTAPSGPHCPDMMRPFAVASDGLQRSDTAVHEWVGLVVYWLTKRSSGLFPGPIQDTL